MSSKEKSELKKNDDKSKILKPSKLGNNKGKNYSPNKTQTKKYNNDFYKTLSEIDMHGNENNVSEKISQNFLILKDQYFEDVRKNLMRDTFMPYLMYYKDTDPNNYKWFQGRTKSYDDFRKLKGQQKEKRIERNLTQISHSNLPNLERLRRENKKVKTDIKQIQSYKDKFLQQTLRSIK